MRNTATITETNIIEGDEGTQDILVQADMDNGDIYEIDMKTMEVTYEPVEKWQD